MSSARDTAPAPQPARRRGRRIAARMVAAGLLWIVLAGALAAQTVTFRLDGRGGQRSITLPPGGQQLETAREVLLRLRIQHFGNLPGCSATVAATLARH